MKELSKQEVIAQIRKDLAAGKEIFTPVWTWSVGRVVFTQAIRELHAAGEVRRKGDGTAHWVRRERLELVG